MKRLFQALRNDTGMAFVVATHLGHGQKSVLGELLSRITSMPVKEIFGSIPIEANHVYVRPPDQRITIADGSLVATYEDSQQVPPAVIDTFLRSLAEHRKNQSVGVILSGSGADGKDGLAAIKDEGGVTFAQDQESASVPEMPRAAAPVADYILPPENIASELARIAAHPYVASSAHSERAAADAEGLTPIFALIRAATNLEFSNYKLATIQRRIHRRMVLHRIETHHAYLRKLQSDQNELDALHADLLINVTQFFRDPEVFEFLKNRIVPNILAKHAGDAPIRIWVPACASGEEAYSIAICFLECIAERGGSETIQVFGTDVSAASIVKARDALYPGAIKEDVSPERLDGYFVQVDGGYRIARFVRDSCVFAIQDVTADPPFSKMDVVSCRNLLIYFKSDIQQKVLATFHYALNSSGILLLGPLRRWAAFQQIFSGYAIAPIAFTKN